MIGLTVPYELYVFVLLLAVGAGRMAWAFMGALGWRWSIADWFIAVFGIAAALTLLMWILH